MKPIRCPECKWDWLRGPRLTDAYQAARQHHGAKPPYGDEPEGGSMAELLSWGLSQQPRSKTLILKCNGGCGNEFEIPRDTAESAIMGE